jgi:hypothetical protein
LHQGEGAQRLEVSPHFLEDAAGALHTMVGVAAGAELTSQLREE